MNIIEYQKIDNRNKRDIKIDFCRAIFSMSIILAHVNPPNLILNIRCFDVTALVMISGMMLKNDINIQNYIKLVYKRIKQLLIPTYLLIIIVGLVSTLACFIIGREPLYSLSTISESFKLVDGIGYVWIVRVYIIIAIISPIIVFINNSFKSDYYIIIISIILIMINSHFYYEYKEINNYFLQNVLLYAIPYGSVALLGLRCYKNIKATNKIIFVYMFVFALYQYTMNVKGIGFNPNIYKYPPNLYYLSYGVVIGLALYRISLSKVFNISNQKVEKLVVWTSINSFSIYLIHIFMLLVVNVMAQSLDNFMIKYIIVCVLTLSTCYFFNIIKLKTRKIVTKEAQI